MVNRQVRSQLDSRAQTPASRLEEYARIAINGWMSELEAHSKSVLGPPVQGQPCQPSVEDQVTLVAWLTKTALVFHSLQKGRLFFTQSDGPLVAERLSPPFPARISIGQYVGSWLTYWSGEAVCAVDNRTRTPMEAYSAVFVVGRLIAHLVCVKVPSGIEFDARWLNQRGDLWGESLVDMWPYESDVKPWPPRLFFDDRVHNLTTLRNRWITKSWRNYPDLYTPSGEGPFGDRRFVLLPRRRD